MPEERARQQAEAIRSIQAFLETKTCYDVLPVSFKLVMLDSTLTMKGALLTLLQNGVVSAPIWNSKESRFSGLITAHNFVNALRYYVDRPRLLDELNLLKLDDLSGIEEQMGAHKMDTASANPMLSLRRACECIVRTRAHRIPLVDDDAHSHRQVVVSVLTQYRVLRFVALNCKETQLLHVPLSELGIASTNVVTTTMDAPLKEVVTTLSQSGVSALPVLDEKGVLRNMYELYDVLTLIKGNGYGDLDMTVGEALMRRPQDFEGVLTCRSSDSLSDIMETIRRSRLLRLFVVDDKGMLEGVITLADILQYICSGDPASKASGNEHPEHTHNQGDEHMDEMRSNE